MKKVVLYIAMSLDGYIADAKGGVHWLQGDGSEKENTGSYPSFIEQIDTIFMGYQTYDQIVRELSPDIWPYSDKLTYVVTHRKRKNADGIVFTDESPSDLVARSKTENGRDIWICGGAAIVNQLLESDLIDRFHITVIPSILGDGIRLFSTYEYERTLRLVSANSYNGMVDLIYERRE